MSNKGVIYILTNPSFPEYVKIGYADDIKTRLAQLNRSECTPFAFRVYATYEVDIRLTDMKIHDIIDKLNPNLRAIDNVEGKKRVREFYAMPAEDAYALFEAMAEIHGTVGRLTKHELTKAQAKAEEMASEIESESQERREKFSFAKLGIEIGETLTFIHDPTITCIVADDVRGVEYNGEITSVSKLAKKLLKRNSSVQGTLHFAYKGEILVDMRERLGV